MNIFESLHRYATSYEVTNRRDFTPEELSQFTSAKVVSSQYGMSVCFYMVSGGQTYIPVSRDSVCHIGDTVDINKAKLLILKKEGSQDIARVEL